MPQDNLYPAIQNLDQYDVFLEEELDNSRYIKIERLSKTFGYGKHYFLLNWKDNKESPYYIKHGSRILYEFKDINGNVVFSDQSNTLPVNGAAVCYVWVKKNPLRLFGDKYEINDGPCTLSVIYELEGGDIPHGDCVYGRSTFEYNILKRVPNSSPILFNSSSQFNSPLKTAIGNTILRTYTTSGSQQLNYTSSVDIFVPSIVGELPAGTGKSIRVFITGSHDGTAALTSNPGENEVHIHYSQSFSIMQSNIFHAINGTHPSGSSAVRYGNGVTSSFTDNLDRSYLITGSFDSSGIPGISASVDSTFLLDVNTSVPGEDGNLIYFQNIDGDIVWKDQSIHDNESYDDGPRYFVGGQNLLSISESRRADTDQPGFERNLITVSSSREILKTDGGRLSFIEVSYRPKNADITGEEFSPLTTYKIPHTVEDLYEVSSAFSDGLNPLSHTHDILIPRNIRVDSNIEFKFRFLNSNYEPAKDLHTDSIVEYKSTQFIQGTPFITNKSIVLRNTGSNNPSLVYYTDENVALEYIFQGASGTEMGTKIVSNDTSSNIFTGFNTALRTVGNYDTIGSLWWRTPSTTAGGESIAAPNAEIKIKAGTQYGNANAQTQFSFYTKNLTVLDETFIINYQGDIWAKGGITASSMYVTGSMTIGGTLTAQEFHTEVTSASIIYESGSSKFGDSSDDTHEMTGSYLLHGSASIGTVDNSGHNLQVAGDISASGAIYGGTPSTEIVSGSGQVLSGWYGSQTRIKILPKDFLPNDDRVGSGLVVEDAVAGSGHGIQVENGSLEMYAYVVVPQGYKATGIKIAGTDTSNKIYAWDACTVGCTLTTLIDSGLSDPARYVGTEYDFDDEFVAGLTNYVLIKVQVAATDDIIFGGYLNIERA